MKNSLVTLLLCGLFIFNCAGKDPEEIKNFLSIRTGLSAPQGYFGSTNIQKTASGFASNGFHVAAETGTFLKRHVGVSITGGLSRNSFEEASYNSQSGGKLYADSGWRTTFVLANLLARLPVGPTFLLYAKAGGGFCLNTYPNVRTSGGSIGSASIPKEPKIKSESLAYGAGAGFMFLANNTGVGLEAYYLGTRSTFSFASNSYKQPMNNLHCSFNLCFKLN